MYLQTIKKKPIKGIGFYVYKNALLFFISLIFFSNLKYMEIFIGV
jgi:hypothetical protein